ncbi:unnamed protein product [Brugia timori]|uniref:Uncharacterized protein n=1 Tax=Brugia timori TaxID=42155 RepID=A0A0R3QSI4_9BILA|nr:unnamed protein product [Brugia timori]
MSDTITTTIITTSAAAITTIPSNCMHLMDLRESDILDNSVDTEEDARIERHMEEHFGIFLCCEINF